MLAWYYQMSEPGVGRDILSVMFISLSRAQSYACWFYFGVGSCTLSSHDVAGEGVMISLRDSGQL